MFKHCYRVQFERMRAGKEKVGFSGFVQRASCLVTADRYHAGSGNETGRWCFTFVQFHFIKSHKGTKIEWMNERMNAWMNGWMNEWMNECVFIYRTYHIMSHGGLKCYWVRSDVSLWRSLWLPLSVHIWLLSHPTHAWLEIDHNTGSYKPYSFR